jgi:hypothetical protein
MHARTRTKINTPSRLFVAFIIITDTHMFSLSLSPPPDPSSLSRLFIAFFIITGFQKGSAEPGPYVNRGCRARPLCQRVGCDSRKGRQSSAPKLIVAAELCPSVKQ